jgi:hypothetical protein
MIDVLLHETKAGYHAKTTDEVKSVLACCYTEYRDNGSVPYTGNPVAVSKYSQREMARRYADLLNGQETRT